VATTRETQRVSNVFILTKLFYLLGNRSYPKSIIEKSRKLFTFFNNTSFADKIELSSQNRHRQNDEIRAASGMDIDPFAASAHFVS
jgi:hypothetical protein